MNRKVTIVTGLWDLKRGDLQGWAQRDFQAYKDRFFEMLEADAQMCIWIPRELEEEVKAIRGDKPTAYYFKELEDFKTWFPFFDKLQEIRTKPEWANFAGWLPESPQAALEFYNPMMMCKMFMVNDSAIGNPFKSEYFYWIDGGLTNTVGKGYFTQDNVFDNLDHYSQCIGKYIHITYPYTGNEEIHGFERKKMAEYCRTDFVEYVARGGFFGGSKELVHTMNGLYYNVLSSTLNEGYMGADECIFTILCHQYPDLIERFEIEGNGLVWPFFEYLKDVKTTLELKKKPFRDLQTILYVITYNSPNQFSKLIQSFNSVEPNFLERPRKVLLNNSTKRETDEEYDKLCEKYGFEQVKKDNIGICGGRQWVAEHFNETDADYYIFFEDDMFLHPNNDVLCKMGHARYTPSLYSKSLSVMYINNYDYVKLSFSEFFGENSVQWAWYNIPQWLREKEFPEKKNLPQSGLDPNPPKTKFTKIDVAGNLPYAEGEVHYCNWPVWFSREGNRKVFLETKWEHPFEQTWMSYVFQKQREGYIKAAVLLLSPINHDRFEFYPAEERREN